MVNLQKHLDLLGMRVADRVTGARGVVTSICFDLYGCIQAVVKPGLDKDQKALDAHFYDVNRLIVTDSTPVMERPQFEWSPQAVSAGEHGAAEKPPAPV